MSLNSTPSGERFHIGFFGRRNAGKSSLVNAFTGQNLSIVSDTLGTTTDPVYKAMELLPVGPVMIVDTPGLDDEGELGQMRITKCIEVMRRIDLALLVIDSTIGLSDEDEMIKKLLSDYEIPTITVFNKTDLVKNEDTNKDFGNNNNSIKVSSTTLEGINELKERVAQFAQGVVNGESGVNGEANNRSLLPEELVRGDIVILVMPIDESAPKGRIILPQQQVIRACLDKGIVAACCKETELEETINNLKVNPSLIVTDSQAFRKVREVLKKMDLDIELTSFSILLAKYKGDYEWQMKGLLAVENLSDGDLVLIAEGCTHHRQCQDIGTVKIPKALRKLAKGAAIQIETVSGHEFPATEEVLRRYKLVVHCGGCTLSPREMKWRVNQCKKAGVPITNYGMVLSKALQIE